MVNSRATAFSGSVRPKSKEGGSTVMRGPEAGATGEAAGPGEVSAAGEVARAGETGLAWPSEGPAMRTEARRNEPAARTAGRCRRDSKGLSILMIYRLLPAVSLRIYASSISFS